MDHGPTDGDPGPSGQRLILLVDDYADALELYAFHLRRMGYSIATAENGEEALRAVAQARPALIVMDLFMPNMTGWEATRRIKEQHPDVPVIALTAKPTDNGHGEESKALFVRVCKKPCLPDALAAEIGAVLEAVRKA